MFWVYILCAFFVFILYKELCSRETYNNRQKWLYLYKTYDVENRDKLKIILKALEDVSFDKHYKALLFRKDPMKLYSQEFRNIVNNNEKSRI